MRRGRSPGRTTLERVRTRGLGGTGVDVDPWAILQELAHSVSVPVDRKPKGGALFRVSVAARQRLACSEDELEDLSLFEVAFTELDRHQVRPEGEGLEAEDVVLRAVDERDGRVSGLEGAEGLGRAPAPER